MVVVIFWPSAGLFASSEDELQGAVDQFYIISEDYSYKISKSKTEIIEFTGKDAILSKICLGGVVWDK